jgi:hypothetical protein
MILDVRGERTRALEGSLGFHRRVHVKGVRMAAGGDLELVSQRSLVPGMVVRSATVVRDPFARWSVEHKSPPDQLLCDPVGLVGQQAPEQVQRDLRGLTFRHSPAPEAAASGHLVHRQGREPGVWVEQATHGTDRGAELGSDGAAGQGTHPTVEHDGEGGAPEELEATGVIVETRHGFCPTRVEA